MAGESKTTTEHEKIKKWVEERNGRPATVKGTNGDEGAGLLRIDFPDYGSKESLKEISWEEFFKKFDEKKLAFLYQEKTKDGEMSRFSRFVSRSHQESGEAKKAKSKKG